MSKSFASRTSAFAFKGKNLSIQKIGQELNVGTVVEGSVRREGDRLRIAAQLVNVADGYLWSKTYERELKNREEKAAAEHAAKTDIGWGHQIRSYVLQPYQMVKDLRTGVSTSDTGGVLDGDLDSFMQAALAQKAFGGGPDAVEDVE